MKIVVLFFLVVLGEFIEEPEDVSSVLGSSVLFRCLTVPLVDVDVTWCQNSFCTLGKSRDLPSYPRYEIVGRADRGEHHFQIVNVSREDLGIYQCQIRAGAKRLASRSRQAKLTLLGKGKKKEEERRRKKGLFVEVPSRLSLDYPLILVVGVRCQLICRCVNGIPDSRLKWFLPEGVELLLRNDYLLLEGDSLRTSISNLTVLASSSLDHLTVRCQAQSAALDLLNVTLSVEEQLVVHCNFFFSSGMRRVVCVFRCSSGGIVLVG